jgi:hypothetical protein
MFGLLFGVVYYLMYILYLLFLTNKINRVISSIAQNT